MVVCDKRAITTFISDCKQKENMRRETEVEKAEVLHSETTKLNMLRQEEPSMQRKYLDTLQVNQLKLKKYSDSMNAKEA